MGVNVFAGEEDVPSLPNTQKYKKWNRNNRPSKYCSPKLHDLLLSMNTKHLIFSSMYNICGEINKVKGAKATQQNIKITRGIVGIHFWCLRSSRYFLILTDYGWLN